jgi:hypothetical protein
MFKTNVPIIFDDINRVDENELMIEVSKHLNKPYYYLDNFTGYIL